MASSLLSEIATQVSQLMLTYFFGTTNPMMTGFFISVFIYIITIGIGLISKMSLDGMLLILGLATLICGTYFLGMPIFPLFIVLAGILVGIAFMRLLRH